MGKPVETFSKKEREKKKVKKLQDKKERAEGRKANSDKGKGLDAMMAYMDDDGNITSVAPDPSTRKKVVAEDIQISIPKQEAKLPSDPFRTGTVTFFNTSKGFGFIQDSTSQESVFVHVGATEEPIAENDKVTFEIENGPKGINAVRVKKVKK